MPKTERVTVTLPADLVAAIDRWERNRSRFITDAVRRELEQRRRDALLRSIETPHPETSAFADEGVAEWAASLPEDEGLVDPAAGQPVRWVEGRGWTTG